MVTPGDEVGVYVVDEFVQSRDGFAVYAARHRGFQQNILLRIASSAMAAEHHQALHLLDHRGVERVLDQGRTLDGLAYTVSERFEGIGISLYCERHRLDVSSRMRLLLQAIQALEYAHRRLQPHHRLTAEDLLVNDAGQVKVCGFFVRNSLVAEQDALGADVRSLGEIAAVLLSGVLSPGGTMSASLAAMPVAEQQEIARLRSTTPKKLMRSLRGDLDAVIRRAMENTPSNAYSSIDLFQLDLARVLAGKATGAYEATRWERLSLWVRFHPTTAIASVLLLLALLGTSATFLRETAALNRQRREAEQRLETLADTTQALETRLYEAASGMPEPVPVRLALLAQTRRTLDTATAGVTLTPALARRIAEQYRKLARGSEALHDTASASANEAKASQLEAGRH